MDDDGLTVGTDATLKLTPSNPDDGTWRCQPRMGLIEIGRHLRNFTTLIVKPADADSRIKLALSSGLIKREIIKRYFATLAEMKAGTVQHFRLNKTTRRSENDVALIEDIALG